MMKQQERFRSWIPHGLEFYSPQTTRRLLQLQNDMRSLFAERGFAEIIPPLLDYAGTFRLTARGGSEGSDLIFESRDSDGELLAFRSDLTVQVVKAVASGRLGAERRGNFSYQQRLLHDRHVGSGQRREILQAGVESIGDDSPQRVGRLLNLAREALNRSGHSLTLVYGDQRFANALFSHLPDRARSDMADHFYHKDHARIKALASELGLNDSLSTLLCEVPITFGRSEALNRLRHLSKESPELLSILDEAATHKQEDLVYDFSLSSDLSYYTGPVFSGYTDRSRESVVTGGVYDDLFARFSGESAAAAGLAVNLSLLLELQG